MSGAESRGRQLASIRDVARLAGVSHQTVSRVINGHPSLRPETRDRVQAVIDELQYRPNPVAQALGTNRSQTIGVIAHQRGPVRSRCRRSGDRVGRPGRGLRGQHGQSDLQHLRRHPRGTRSAAGPPGGRADHRGAPGADPAGHRRSRPRPAVRAAARPRPRRPARPVRRPAGRGPDRDPAPARSRASRHLPPGRSAGLDRGRGPDAGLPGRDDRRGRPGEPTGAGGLDGRFRLLRRAGTRSGPSTSQRSSPGTTRWRWA